MTLGLFTAIKIIPTLLLGFLTVGDSTHDDAKLAKFVLAGFRDSLDKTRSGHCRVELGNNSKQMFFGAESTTIYFVGDDHFRMDWVYPRKNAQKQFLANTIEYEMHPDISQLTGYFVRTPDRTIHWLEGKLSITVTTPESDPMGYVSEFDVMAFGMSSWMDIKIGRSARELIDIYSEKAILTAKELDGQVYELTWQVGDYIQWSVDFDESKGYVPVGGQLRERRNVGDPWRVTQKTETQWEEFGGSYVPIDAKLATFENGKQVESLHFKVIWESVNESFDDQTFHYNSFGLGPPPNIVGVDDYRLGSRLEIKAHGDPFQRIVTLPPGMSSLRLWVVILSLAGIGGYLFWTWSKKSA